jgi:hypothetical protein
MVKQQYAGSTILFHLPLTCDVTCCATPSLTLELHHSFYPPLRCVYVFVCYTGTNDLRHTFTPGCTQCIYFCFIWDVNFVSSGLSFHLWIHCFFWAGERGGCCDPMLVMASSFLTPHSVGLLWTSDQLVAETCTWQHTTLTTDKHPCSC